MRSGWASIFTGLAVIFCLHLLLFSAGALLLWECEACPYVIPRWYSHSIVATSKIADCPRALHSFYSRTGHVSSPRWFTQWACIIASNPLLPAKHLLLMWFDLSDLHIWDWLVECEHLHFLTAYHQQTALLTLGHFTLHFSFPISTCPRSLLMDSSLPFTRPFWPQALFPLTHTDCLETFFFFNFKRNN